VSTSWTGSFNPQAAGSIPAPVIELQIPWCLIWCLRAVVDVGNKLVDMDTIAHSSRHCRRTKQLNAIR